MTDPKCPLGADCDLTVAYMAGAEDVRQTYRAQLEDAKVREGLARHEADQLRQRAEWAEARGDEMAAALNEVRPLVLGAGFAKDRYPRAWAWMMGEVGRDG